MKIPSTRASAQTHMASLAQAGAWPEALQFARAVLRRWPDDAAGQELAALACRALGQPAEAARYYKRLCALQPTVGALLNEYANMLLEAGQPAEAEAVIARRLQDNREDPRAMFLLGRIHEARNDWPKAASLYRLATQMAPDFAEAWLNLGAVLEAGGDFPAADVALTEAQALDPGSAKVLAMRSAVLLELKRPEEALQFAEAALGLAPGSDDALLARGCALRDLDRLEEAERDYRQILAGTSPRRFWATLNLMTQLVAAERLPEADDLASQLITLTPDSEEGFFYRGLERLRRGDLPGGWADYEARFKLRGEKPRFDVPEGLPAWPGGALRGARILCLPEQGFGDLIQFCRFVPRLRALGAARIGVGCRAPVARLLGSLEGVDEVVSVDAPLSAAGWDFWVPVMSLPDRLKLTLEDLGSPGYVRAPESAVAAWQARVPRPAIGLVWRGNPGFRNDANRSLPGPRTFTPLAALKGVTWVNLQKDATPAELAEAAEAGLPLLDVAPELGDFMDTAAVISALDLVISVDTSVAHLAGALGRPCRTLLPAIGCDWRWLRGREDSPWYGEDFRLLRQQTPGDWSGVIEALRGELVGR